MLGLRRDELDELDRAAQLHDLGKLAVPDEILQKPGPLDEREWAFVRQHTIVGERILRASPALRSVATVVRASHENWDGSGYPDGLAGEEIPLASRIIRACNAFVAMISRRPYRDAMPIDEALNELMRSPEANSTRPSCASSSRTSATSTKPSERRSRGAGILARARPRSSVDRAADFESAGGGSTPPGATQCSCGLRLTRSAEPTDGATQGAHATFEAYSLIASCQRETLALATRFDVGS